jgi:hypothetical protein
VAAVLVVMVVVVAACPVGVCAVVARVVGGVTAEVPVAAAEVCEAERVAMVATVVDETEEARLATVGRSRSSPKRPLL